MCTISLNKENTYTGNLILINEDNPVKTRAVEKYLNLVSFDSGYDILLEARASSVLSLLLSDLNCKDQIIPVSGYRPLEEQEQIFYQSIKENGEAFTRKYVALPDRSEHQTGLAVDLALKEEYIDNICPNFPYEGICQKFRMACTRYGFIQRYQKGKESITKISHEPWHFRYVGYPHSEIINTDRLTLEEYIESVRRFSYEEKHLLTENNIEIFYVDLSGIDYGETVDIEVPDKTLYQISGNNKDGAIITVWRETQ